jgi:hypothetical protein
MEQSFVLLSLTGLLFVDLVIEVFDLDRKLVFNDLLAVSFASGAWDADFFNGCGCAAGSLTTLLIMMLDLTAGCLLRGDVRFVGSSGCGGASSVGVLVADGAGVANGAVERIVVFVVLSSIDIWDMSLRADILPGFLAALTAFFLKIKYY